MLKTLVTVLVTVGAAAVFGLTAGSANAYVTFTDGSAAHAEGRCHSLSKGVTFRVDNHGNQTLFYRVIAWNLDDGSLTSSDAWSQIDPRANMADTIQLSTFLGPVHDYLFYLQYARYIGGRWEYHSDWIYGVGVCRL